MAHYNTILFTFIAECDQYTTSVFLSGHHVILCTGCICRNILEDAVGGMLLYGFTYDTVTTVGYQQCLKACQRQQECRSINYHRESLTCGLNTGTVHGCKKDTCPEFSMCVTLHNGNTTCIVNTVPSTSTTTTTPSTTSTSTTTTTPSTTSTSTTTTTPSTTSTSTTTTTPSTTSTSTTTTTPSTTSTSTTTTTPSTTSTTATTTTTTTSPPTCVGDYTYNAASGLCLYVGPNMETKENADKVCSGINGRLVVAETTAKQLAVADLVKFSEIAENCWVGASWVSATDHFVWSDGTVISAVLESSGDCVRVRQDGVLLKGTCTTALVYICEAI